MPVRVTDLRHLKRDIKAIPDGQGKFDNAFWGFGGVGVPLIISELVQPNATNIIGFYAGIVFMVIAVVFKLFGWKARNDRNTMIRRIMENINDFSNGELTDEPDPPGFRARLQDAVIRRIQGTS